MAKDPYKYFRIEARELVDGLAKGLLELEKRGDVEVVARLLRIAHTLKGAARIVKQRELADLAHALEDLLAPLRDAPVPKRLDGGLALVDRMTAALAALPAPEVPVGAAPVRTEEAATAPRIDLAAIDDVLAGLAEVHALVGRIRAAADAGQMPRHLDQLDREVRGVRYDAERLRLLPIGSVFTPLERTARDAALATGKRVTFSGVGGEARADAQVLGALHGALIQLVRNAVVHGIEAPEQRAALGKPSDGIVAVSVRSQGRRLTITCEDDGRGLDVEAIQRAAQRRGAATGHDVDSLVRALLAGGISTATEVTELAGRGVGLNVVHEAVRTLGGEVTARTRSGGGTTIAITVPVSVAATTVLGVESGDRAAAIPLDSIRRVERVDPARFIRGPEGISVAFDDVMVRHASLARVLGGRGDVGSSVVFVESPEGVAAIGVDRVLGVDDVVVRALPAGVPIDPVVWGMALESTGVLRPILDATALVAVARREHAEPIEEAARPVSILVVDDSLTTRMLEQSILQSAGYDVQLASSAEEALDVLTGNVPSLILVDVEMPGMDGFTFVAELRARPALAAIPAILVTSRDAPEDRRRGAAVGAQGYVIKSQFDQVDLLAMIRRLVSS
jgi:two-component system chemotaxis sensor kinase CheA